jgi:hypothetical protein
MEQTQTAMLRSQPDVIVARAEEIYVRKFKTDFEQRFRGKFVVIDITSERAYPGEYPEDAVQSAMNASPHGVFHLIRVGSRAAHTLRGYGH